MGHIASKWSILIAQQLGVSNEQQDIYRYGIEVFLSTSIFILLSIFIGCLTNRLIDVIIFLFGILPIRSLSGGYHASSSERCLVISLSMLGICFLLSDKVSIPILIAISLASTAVIYLCAPVIHPFCPHSDNYAKILGWKARFLACIECSSVLALAFFSKRYACMLGVTYGIAAFSTLIAWVQKRFRLAEYQK